MDMLKIVFNIWKGKMVWHVLKIQHRINYEKVVLVLKEDDNDWNRCAILHLQDYMRRKSVDKAVVLHSPNIKAETLPGLSGENIKAVRLSIKNMQYLTDYYCCYRFYDNIAFCFKNSPQDNNAEEILEKGEISKEELICLAFFHLRCVPKLSIRETICTKKI